MKIINDECIDKKIQSNNIKVNDIIIMIIICIFIKIILNNIDNSNQKKVRDNIVVCCINRNCYSDNKISCNKRINNADNGVGYICYNEICEKIKDDLDINIGYIVNNQICYEYDKYYKEDYKGIGWCCNENGCITSNSSNCKKDCKYMPLKDYIIKKYNELTKDGFCDIRNGTMCINDNGEEVYSTGPSSYPLINLYEYIINNSTHNTFFNHRI